MEILPAHGMATVQYISETRYLSLEELIQRKTIAFCFLITLKFRDIEIWDINRNETTVDFKKTLLNYPAHENSTYDYGEIIRDQFTDEPLGPSIFDIYTSEDYYIFNNYDYI